MDSPENRVPLIPRKVIEASGKMAYDEKVGAWSVIRLKSEFYTSFYQLKEKRTRFEYKLSYFHEYEELENLLKELKKKGIPPPALLFFFKGREDQTSL